MSYRLFDRPRLIKQSNGRWAIGTDELNSGDCIKLCIPGKIGRVWYHGRIEHGAEGYYFLWVDLNGGEGKPFRLKEGMEAMRSKP